MRILTLGWQWDDSSQRVRNFVRTLLYGETLSTASVALTVIVQHGLRTVFSVQNKDMTIDEKELISAEWLSRAELKATTPDSPVQLPRPDSIARRLIEEWLAED